MQSTLSKIIITIILFTVAMTTNAYAASYYHPKMPRDLTLPANIPQFQNVDQVSEYVNQFTYKADPADHWKTPKEFFRDGTGDCEDYAIAKLAIIKAQHLAKSASVALVIDPMTDQVHAILVADGVEYDSQPWRKYIYVGEVKS